MSLAAISQPLLDILVPAGITLGFQNSFLFGWSMKVVKADWARGLLTCPLCLGFHVSWGWCLWKSWNIMYSFPLALMTLILGALLAALRSNEEKTSLEAFQMRQQINTQSDKSELDG